MVILREFKKDSRLGITGLGAHMFTFSCFMVFLKLQVLSGIALLSFRAAKAPRDKEHPYG